MHSPLQSPLQPVMRSPLEFRRRGGFNIASTNPSAYYDRTNLATLFQDSAGTTPVTAGSQPIGLGLDQSQGLELGPELVTNGTFDTDLTGWDEHPSFATGTAEWVSGRLHYVGSGTRGLIGESAASVSTFTAGKRYKVSLDIEVVSGSGPSCGVNVSYYSAPIIELNSAGFNNLPVGTHHKEAIVVAQVSGNGHFNFDTSENPIGEWYVDNISVKLLPGNHQSQATAGKRPLTAGSPIYADFDGVDDDLVTTFPASLGAGCTVCRSLPGTGASITTGVTLTATYTDNVDAHALLIYTSAQWAALDAGQIANITTWLNAKAGV